MHRSVLKRTPGVLISTSSEQTARRSSTPRTGRLLSSLPGSLPERATVVFDNHYPDHVGRVWSVASATEDGSALATVYVTDPKTLSNVKTISLGQNVVHTPGLTPDRKFAVVPVSSENKLHVYDTKTFEEVATINVGVRPWDMMVSADGKYCCEPDMDSDTLTIIDPKTWKVIGTVPTGEGTGPFMVTIWPDNKTASVECSGHHGAEYNHLAPPAVPTGKGFSIRFVDLVAAVGHQEHPAGLPRRVGRIHGGRQIQLLLWVRGREDRRRRHGARWRS